MVTRLAHNQKTDGSIPSPATVTLNVVFDYYTQGNELKLPKKKKSSVFGWVVYDNYFHPNSPLKKREKTKFLSTKKSLE